MQVNELVFKGDGAMKSRSLPRLVIFGDPKKGRVSEAVDEFTGFAEGKVEIVASYCVDDCTTEMFEKCDFAVVFGGDGSIISAARNLRQSNVPVIGVNLGKLGFLAEFNVAELKEHLDKILTGKVRIEKRMMLECKVFAGEKEKISSTAINDVFITAGAPYKMIELKISVNGQPLASCVSDGLIVATPTGSTAYNLSAGGPILSARMEGMVITPLSPHSLSFRPIVISADSKVEVRGERVNEGTTLSIDGQVSCGLLSSDVVQIRREANDFLVVNNPLRSQWDTLATKLRWAEKPKYGDK